MAKSTSIHANPPASLKDIARELDVSFSLVSKVLSGRMGTTGASASVKEAIIRKAKEMNYRPNPLATALKQGRKGAVGALIHPMGLRGGEHISDFIKGLSSGLDDSGLRLWLRIFETDDEFARHFDQRARNDVDGLIVAGVSHPSTYEMVRSLHRDGLPIVTSFEYDHIEGIPNVRKDNLRSCYLTTQHLLASGRRRLAHFKTIQPRYEGFLAAHAQARIPTDPRLTIDCSDQFDYNAGVTAASALLDTGLDFDGIVAQSDHQAVGAIQELLRRGKRVPEDVSVTGVDDSALCDVCVVPITSVTSEMEAIGRKTAVLLALKIQGQTPASVVLEPRLVLRTSG